MSPTPSRRSDEPRLVPLAEGCWAYLQPDGGWCLNNCGVYVGDEAVTLIDTTATVARARALRTAVARLTSLPVTTVINTHHHADHTFGNRTAAPDATVVAHRATPGAMAEAAFMVQEVWPEVDWGEIVPKPADHVYDDRMTLPAAGRPLHLHHPGIAHTDNDTVVWDPETRVLFTGDICFSGATPYCVDGSLTGTLDALRAMTRLDPAVVVAGHGPPGGPEILHRDIAYLESVREGARRGLAAGRTPLEQARATDPGPYANLLNPERLVANLHRAYAEEAGGDPYAPIDVPQALRDVVALAGGRTPPCHA
ncbi:MULTISPECIES: MBL fold metallo-hydrolase [unclassified Streptomyces]|uniref:MBL fold metallo-hydrolase n=1 Tax=unclassified Streptomyces TaxID=2593676 RepID=UPI0034502754